MKRLNQKGFTLVELIVVIAIIAVLAGVVLVVINPAALLAKSRDAKRLSDIDALHKAITLAIADAELALTPAAGTSSITGTTALDGTGWVKFTFTAPKVGLAKYLPTLPTDPINGTCTDANLNTTATCAYTFASTATTYEINAVLESPDNVLKMSTDGGNAPGIYEVGTSLTVL
jgi:prepilin-type N-terminal cleavage/methylation domain-containing protein